MKKGMDLDAGDSAPPLTVGSDRLVVPQLPLLRLELDFVMDEPVALPAFRGNLWRGILGPALKRIDEGLLPGVSTGAVSRGTLYSTFFESPPPPDATRMRRYKAAPHPYVVDAPGRAGPERLAPGDTERIGLTLVGRAATAAEAVLAGFDFAARVGIGQALGAERERGRAHLAQARAVWRGAAADTPVFDATGYRPLAPEPPEIPPCPSRLRVILATPLRLARDGKPVGPRRFPAGQLVANLVRRVSMMCAFYTDTPLETDFRALKQLWDGLVTHEPMLAFADQTRWSGSQQQELAMGGVIGSFVLDLRGREPLWPYLWLGQWLHAGKGAVLGMGGIRVRAE